MRSRVARWTNSTSAGSRSSRTASKLRPPARVIAAASAPRSSSHSVSRPQTTPSIAKRSSVTTRRADADRLAAARLDEDVVGRQPGNGAQHARLAVLLPVAQQHHLRRERRVAVDREELRRQRHARSRAPSARTIASLPSTRTSESTFTKR